MAGKYLYDNDGYPLKEVVIVNEGDVTITEGDRTRGTTWVAVYGKRMQYDDVKCEGGQFVPDGLTDDGLIRVKPVELTDTLPVVGEFASNPRGETPEEAKSWGQYKPREADGLFYGKRIRMKTVVAGGTKIPAGSYLKPSTSALGKYIVSATETSMITFGEILANSEKLVPVLEKE